MARFVATLRVLVEAADQAEACDLLNETFRPLLQEFCENPAEAALVDWGFTTPDGPTEASDADLEFFKEGE